MESENPSDGSNQPTPIYGSVPHPAPDLYPPPPGYYQASLEQNPKALWSMILGIAGIACCFVGFALGIAAIVLAVLAKKEFAAAPGRTTGEGMATAGMVLGIIAIVVSVLNIGLTTIRIFAFN